MPILIFNYGKSQDSLEFYPGPIIEIGAAYSTAKWHAYSNPPYQKEEDYYRNQFNIQPVIRIGYESEILPNFVFTPFMGYSKYGGKSKTDYMGYKDEFWINAFEVGFLAKYCFRQFRIASGVKFNYHFEMTRRFYEYNQSTLNREWKEIEETFFFRDNSFDLGFECGYIFSNWLFSCDTWFNISPLEKNDLSKFVSIHQINYRILIGYKWF